MSFFGDEVGVVWAESRASARDFIRGMAEVSMHNPLRVRIEEKVAEVKRHDRREEAAKAQAVAAAEDKAHALDELKELLEAAATFEETGEIDRRLIPECKEAIQAELAADSRDLQRAADMQEVPELRGAAKELGWDFDSARADNDFVYVTLKRKREKIANAGTRPTKANMRRNIARALAGFRPQELDRRRIVSDARELIASVLTPLQPAAP